MNTPEHLQAARRARYRNLAPMSIDQVESVIRACHKSGVERRRVLWRNNLIVFELAVLAGLQVKEMEALKMQDVAISCDRPHLALSDRIVPLMWCGWLLEDISDYMDRRVEDGAHERSPLLVSLRTTGLHGSSCYGTMPNRVQIHSWYLTACKKSTVPIHGLHRAPGGGRESFIAAAIAAGIGQQTVYAATGIPFLGQAEDVLDRRFDGVVFRPKTPSSRMN